MGNKQTIAWNTPSAAWPVSVCAIGTGSYHLPDEILVHILAFLLGDEVHESKIRGTFIRGLSPSGGDGGGVRGVLSARLVCRRWYHCATDISVWAYPTEAYLSMFRYDHGIIWYGDESTDPKERPIPRRHKAQNARVILETASDRGRAGLVGVLGVGRCIAGGEMACEWHGELDVAQHPRIFAKGPLEMRRVSICMSCASERVVCNICAKDYATDLCYGCRCKFVGCSDGCDTCVLKYDDDVCSGCRCARPECRLIATRSVKIKP
jgi:hypothetical protein